MLRDKGAIPPFTRRVVIDAEPDNVLIVYLEMMGDERFLDVSLEEGKIIVSAELAHGQEFSISEGEKMPDGQ